MGVRHFRNFFAKYSPLVEDKEVVELPVATEVQDKDMVFQDRKEMLKMATGHEEDAG